MASSPFYVIPTASKRFKIKIFYKNSKVQIHHNRLIFLPF